MSPELFDIIKTIGTVIGLMSPITLWVWNISSRVQRLETKSTTYPTNGDVHKLQLSIEKLLGEVKTLSAKLENQGESYKRIERIIDRQQDHLLNKDK